MSGSLATRQLVNAELFQETYIFTHMWWMLTYYYPDKDKFEYEALVVYHSAEEIYNT